MLTHPVARPESAPWPQHSGEVARILRSFGPDSSPLGPPAQWPPLLRQVLNQALHSQAQIVLLWGPAFLLFYNDASTKALGNTHPTSLGQPAEQHWGRVWSETLQPMIRRVYETGVTLAERNQPFSLSRHGSKELAYFDYSLSPLVDEAGAIHGVLSITTETTELIETLDILKQTAAQLSEQQNLTEQAQLAAGVSIFDIDLRTDTLHASAGFCTIFGLPHQEEMPASLVAALHAPEHSSAPADRLSTAKERREGTLPLTAVYPIIRANDGELRWISRRATFELDDDGTPLHMRGVVQDVTEQHLAKLALQGQNASLAQSIEERTRERNQLWELSLDIMGVTDMKGRITAINPAALKMFDLQESDLLGRSFLDLVSPEDRTATAHQLQLLQQGQVVHRFENRWQIPGKPTRRISWNAVPRDGAIHAVGRDVTALREAEQRRHHSQKLEAIGQLTGGIAHDFNNLLQGISGALEVMRRRIAKGHVDQLDGFLNSASQSAHRAATLVQRLLAFSRRQSLNLRAVDANALICSMAELMTRTLGEQVELMLALDPDALPVYGDEGQLETAILNLAINARDAMPNGGKLHLSTRNQIVTSEPGHHPSELQPGSYLMLSVQDTGSGMTEDVLTQAFDPFYTTKALGQGTGLGLSMVYGFAQQAGGHVTLVSQPHQGTTATLWLPHAKSAVLTPSSVPALAPSQHAEHNAQHTVLVVEDDPGVRLLVVELLKEEGFRTLEAADGRAALPYLQGQEPIDLMLSDVGLPGINGRQLAEIARTERPGIRVLLMSGYSEYALDRAAFLGPGLDMIAKPFASQDMLTHVQQILAQPAPATPQQSLDL